jgi:predicted permease
MGRLEAAPRVFQDLRYAIRSLTRRPLVTTVAVLSLALGIGVNTAIFSLFDRLLLRRLPVPSPEEIVLVTSPGPHPGGRDTSGAGGAEAIFSYPLFRDLERLDTGALRLAAHRDFGVHLAYRGQTSSGIGALVSGQYFPALGITPALGRLFGPEDDRVLDAHPIAVLSFDYWNARFGADPRVLDDTIVVNGQAMTIVGVTPAGFTGTAVWDSPQVFIPLAMARQAFRDTTSRNSHWLYVFGRRAPGVSQEQAEARINVPFTALIRDVEFPVLSSGMVEPDRPRFLQRRILLQDGALPRVRDRAPIRIAMVLLFAITGFVLAIACANVANLLLTRISDRTIEMSVRLSLGASPRRVIRLLLVEVLLLGAIGCGGALVVGWITTQGLLAILPTDLGPLLAFEFDGTMLAFTAAIGVGTSLLFGVFPALHGVRVATLSGAHMHAQRISGSRAASRFRASMATTQVALATALLAVAGLFVASLINVSRVELGIQRAGLVTFRVSPVASGYSDENARAFFARLEDELRALPGVTAVTATTVALLSSDGATNRMAVEGFDAGPDADTSASYGRTSTDYFRTLGIPMLEGRDFTVADSAGSAQVAIVNEAFVRKFNLAGRAIGTRMAMGLKDQPLNIQIVGIVRDSKYREVKEPARAQFFMPYRQGDVGSLTFYVRRDADSRALLGMIAPLVRRLDTNLPIESLRTMDDQIWENMTQDRMISTLSSAFAALAVVLAAIGLYAVLAYGVAQRMREIGIRIALGARHGDVRWLVLSQVGRISLVGGVVGGALALAIGRITQAMLFDVQGINVPIIGGALLLILLVVVAAGILPARRATAVDPVTVLRAE